MADLSQVEQELARYGSDVINDAMRVEAAVRDDVIGRDKSDLPRDGQYADRFTSQVTHSVIYPASPLYVKASI